LFRYFDRLNSSKSCGVMQSVWAIVHSNTTLDEHSAHDSLVGARYVMPVVSVAMHASGLNDRYNGAPAGGGDVLHLHGDPSGRVLELVPLHERFDRCVRAVRAVTGIAVASEEIVAASAEVVLASGWRRRARAGSRTHPEYEALAPLAPAPPVLAV